MIERLFQQKKILQTIQHMCDTERHISIIVAEIDLTISQTCNSSHLLQIPILFQVRQVRSGTRSASNLNYLLMTSVIACRS